MKCICGYEYNPNSEDAKYKISESKFIEIIGIFKIRKDGIANNREVKLYACPWCGTVRI